MRIVVSVLLFLLSFVIALPAAPQDTRPIFYRPPGAAAPESSPVASPEDPEARLREILLRWPAPAARAAAARLAESPPTALATALSLLDHNDWRLRAAGAFVLGEIGAAGAVEALKRGVRDEGNRICLAEFLTALQRIRPEEGLDALLELAASPSTRARLAVAACLPERVDPRFRPRIVALLGSEHADVREVACRLLGAMHDGARGPELPAALGDPRPRVAMTAARILAQSSDSGIVAELRRHAESGTGRRAAYATLALVLVEDRTGESVLPAGEEVRSRWYRDVFREDRGLERGVAAVALANLAAWHDDPRLRELGDGYLVPILIETVAGGVYFPDYESIEDLAFSRMERLTGVSFGKNAARWRQWWNGLEGRFTARRVLRGLAAEDAARILVTLRRAGADGRERRLALAGPDAADAHRQRAVILPGGDLERLVGILRESGIFTAPAAAESALDAGTTLLAVRVGSGERSWRVRGEPPEGLRCAIAEFEELRRSQVWQAFWDRDAWPDRAAWYAAKSVEFSGPGAESRADLLLAAAVDALDDMVSEEVEEAERILRAAPAGFAEARSTKLLAALEAQPSTGAAARLVLDLLAPVPGPLITGACVTFVLDHRTPDAAAVLAGFLARRPVAEVLELAGSPRGEARAAAATALGGVPGDRGTIARLIDLLRDFEPAVRSAALAALARHEDPVVLPLLREIVERGEDGNLRIAAIEALGEIGGAAEVARLTELHREGERAVRFAALRGLGRTRSPEAHTNLIGIVTGAGELEVREEALRSLLAAADAEVLDRLRSLLVSTRDATVARMLMGGLAATLGPAFASDLEPLLASQDPVIRRLAIFELAAMRSPLSVPALLDLLLDRNLARPSREALERVACLRIDGEDPALVAESWRNWWAEASGGTERGWLLAALEREGRTDSARLLAPWVSGSALDAEGAGVLVAALESSAWFVRVAAAAALEAAFGVSFGDVDRLTDPAELRRIASAFAERVAAGAECRR